MFPVRHTVATSPCDFRSASSPTVVQHLATFRPVPHRGVDGGHEIRSPRERPVSTSSLTEIEGSSSVIAQDRRGAAAPVPVRPHTRRTRSVSSSTGFRHAVQNAVDRLPSSSTYRELDRLLPRPDRRVDPSIPDGAGRAPLLVPTGTSAHRTPSSSVGVGGVVIDAVPVQETYLWTDPKSGTTYILTARLAGESTNIALSRDIWNGQIAPFMTECANDAQVEAEISKATSFKIEGDHIEINGRRETDAPSDPSSSTPPKTIPLPADKKTALGTIAQLLLPGTFYKVPKTPFAQPDRRSREATPPQVAPEAADGSRSPRAAPGGAPADATSREAAVDGGSARVQAGATPVAANAARAAAPATPSPQKEIAAALEALRKAEHEPHLPSECKEIIDRTIKALTNSNQLIIDFGPQFDQKVRAALNIDQNAPLPDTLRQHLTDIQTTIVESIIPNSKKVIDLVNTAITLNEQASKLSDARIKTKVRADISKTILEATQAKAAALLNMRRAIVAAYNAAIQAQVIIETSNASLIAQYRGDTSELEIIHKQLEDLDNIKKIVKKLEDFTQRTLNLDAEERAKIAVAQEKARTEEEKASQAMRSQQHPGVFSRFFSTPEPPALVQARAAAASAMRTPPTLVQPLPPPLQEGAVALPPSQPQDAAVPPAPAAARGSSTMEVVS